MKSALRILVCNEKHSLPDRCRSAVPSRGGEVGKIYTTRLFYSYHHAHRQMLPPALDDNSRALFSLALVLVLALYSFLPGTHGAAQWTVLSCWSHG